MARKTSSSIFGFMMKRMLDLSREGTSNIRPDEIVLNNLYLGPIDSAANPRTVMNFGITHIVNCSGFGPDSDFWKNGWPEWAFLPPGSENSEPSNQSQDSGSFFVPLNPPKSPTSNETLNSEPFSFSNPIPPPPRYLHIDIRDAENVSIRDYFKSSTEFISEAINSGGKVLCHCAAGISRSTTLVIAYMMISQNCMLDEAWKDVSKKRKGVRPNMGFAAQLIILHIQLSKVRERNASKTSNSGSGNPESQGNCESSTINEDWMQITVDENDIQELQSGGWKGCDRFAMNYPKVLLEKTLKTFC
ncbi:hypothetical protein HK098_004072 [Nowakowskiella sp. JEL0407]|nr:hypothetical protein HK098_004072 [Nowakowskiella sp. JEL0407]